MNRHLYRGILVALVLSVTATAACIVRTHPSRSRHSVVHDDDHGKHKKYKKHKKHKGKHKR